MLSPQALFKLLISRALPPPNPDSQSLDVPISGTRYGEARMASYVRKAHLLADEGSYFITNNAQTGILSSPAVGFVATTPSLIIINNDSGSNPYPKRIYLDYIELLVTAAGVTATATQAKYLAAIIDATGRFSSGGTNLTSLIVSPNMDMLPASVAQVYFGALTATGASVSARVLAGQRLVRFPVTATTAPDLAGDTVRIEFGSVEPPASNQSGSAGVLQANGYYSTIKMPPVVLGPRMAFLLYLWQLVAGGTYTTATTYVPEVGWWER
jgi:hypothetical protein